MIKSMAAYNGREIPKEDKVFAACAKALDAVSKYGPADVINATVGALYDDEGKLLVFKSVEKAMKELPSDKYAAYAPIAGTPGFREAILKAALGGYEPKSYTCAVGTPGGTGAIRNAVANYSCPGDKILTHNWHWAPYRSIADELYRGIECFEMFDEDGRFNIADFDYKVKKLTRNQEHLVIILNTPANNPTGYTLTMDDWYGVKKVLDEVSLEKKIALVLDVAYIDFAGEPEEVRGFYSVIDNLRANILPIIAYSASKTFTLYGARCAAMICLAHNPEVAEEFGRINSFSSRATWSNPPRAPQEVIERVYADEELLAEVEAERAKARSMLLARGKAFEEEAAKCGLKTLPFSAGFFVTIPYKDPDGLCDKLSEKNVFLIPFDGGVRASVAASSEEKCRRLPALIKSAMEELD
jgi:aspartate/tyrosine/aromatic aminotransferase